MTDFEGSSVIVTGGAGGMGRATVLAFARAGAAVVLADVDDERGEETAQLARRESDRVAYRRCDVAVAEDVVALVAHAVERHGGLHCAVNAAAIEFEDTAIADEEDADFDRIIAVNLRSVFLCMKHELRAMLAAGGGGAIVNIASTSGLKPQATTPAYVASKHGVIGLTRSAAYDYAAHGIRVNAICPGPIDTPMLRKASARRGRSLDEAAERLSLFGRLGHPDDVANAALFLCSDRAAYTTGQLLGVDGGLLIK